MKDTKTLDFTHSSPNESGYIMAKFIRELMLMDVGSNLKVLFKDREYTFTKKDETRYNSQENVVI